MQPPSAAAADVNAATTDAFHSDFDAFGTTHAAATGAPGTDANWADGDAFGGGDSVSFLIVACRTGCVVRGAAFFFPIIYIEISPWIHFPTGL